MNIFYLDPSPQKAAQAHCDKHVVKQVLETAQLLSTAHRILDGNSFADKVGLYRLTHQNHPCALWVRSTDSTYQWAHQLLIALCNEYTFRYEKKHKTSSLISPLSHLPKNIKTKPFIPPPACMPDEYKVRGDCVASYKNYYKGAKSNIAEWNKNRQKPLWF
jgi:hypothetical protein